MNIDDIRRYLLGAGWIDAHGNFVGDPYSAYAWAAQHGISARDLEIAATGAPTGAVDTWAANSGLPPLTGTPFVPAVAPVTVPAEIPQGTMPPPEVQPVPASSSRMPLILGAGALALLLLGRRRRG